MSVCGQEQKSSRALPSSALPPKADIRRHGPWPQPAPILASHLTDSPGDRFLHAQAPNRTFNGLLKPRRRSGWETRLLQRSNPRFGRGLIAVLAANKGRINAGMGLDLQQLPDHLARFVDSAEIDERHSCRSIAAY